MKKVTAKWLGLGILSLAVISGGLAVTTAAHDGDDDNQGQDSDRYAIGLWGDLPYSTIQATVGIPNLIADMNSQRLAFTAFDGDLKAGSNSPCNDALYTGAMAYFDALKAPAVFTPGDNDWTDCDRPSNGGFNSLERLDHERQVFFSTPFSQGQHKIRQQVQTDLLCLGVSGLVPCVENRRWTVGDVTYATLNIQGSCNNLCDTDPSVPEFEARNHANIVWMQETFAEATHRHSAAVMLISQGNPGWDLNDGLRDPFRDPKTLTEKLLISWTPPAAPVLADSTTDGYKEFLTALRTEVVAFRRPVAYVHGDSHYFRTDRPFLDSLGRRLENFTRVETFGDNASDVTQSNDVMWVKVTVDPHSREVFSYQAQIVPGNRIAVPAP
jgi:hypothetical protein